MPLYSSMVSVVRTDEENTFTALQTFHTLIKIGNPGDGWVPSEILSNLVGDTRTWRWPDRSGVLVVANAPASVAVNTTLTAEHDTVLATVGVSGITLSLPAASSLTIGRTHYLFKVDSGIGLLTIAPNGTNTLNGVNAAKTIANQWNGCRIQCISATGWIVTSFTGL